MKSRLQRVALPIVICAACAPATAQDSRSSATTRPDAPNAAAVKSPSQVFGTALFAARSDDGLVFKPAGGSVVSDGAHPTAVVLPDDSVLVVYVGETGNGASKRTGLRWIRSTDGGKSWSSPRDVQLAELAEEHAGPRDPALARGAKGELILFFSTQNKRRRVTTHVARLTEPGRFEVTETLQFQRDETTPRLLLPHYHEGTWLVLGVDATRTDARYLGEWNGGRKIRRIGSIEAKQVGIPRSVVRLDKGLRLYGSAPAGVVSATSNDGRRWKPDTGVRLLHATDPAVVRLADHSYLMIHARLAASGTTRRIRSEDETETVIETIVETDEVSFDPAESAKLAAEAAGQAADPQDMQTRGEGVGEESIAVDEPAATESEAPQRIVFGEAAVDENELSIDELTADEMMEFVGDVPLPDFRRHVDYRSWIENRYDAEALLDNAFDRYAAIMPHLYRDDEGQAPRPKFLNMFSDQGHTGPPVPWDPAEHPEWESSRLETADLLSRFAEAASMTDYVRRIEFARTDAGADPADGGGPGLDDDGRNLLINVMLPDLSGHRSMVRQVLSDAWRSPDGRVDGDAMIRAVETVLGSANHVGQGDFLIDMLVGVAEKRLVHDNTLSALNQGVFDERQMETMIDVLSDNDGPLRAPSDWMAGELASELDMAQYVYGPIRADREPTLNLERMRLVAGLGGEGEGLTPEQLANADPQRTVDTFVNHVNSFVEMASRGYPEVKARDLEEMSQAAVRQDPVARYMLPSLSRVYQLANRHEATRRATRLTLAIHLYKSRNGRWPATLDELPPRHTEGVRTDPFSGTDFRYRLTEQGPILYSTSENGVDDGGIHNSRWGDRRGDGESPSDDYVFWPRKPR